ncbi:MAG: hypothetical protein HYW48_12210 [Deltaproteobacteria bacterium]|nr:hypothetical protein [Deltaproteobacteria bacterium]
MEGHSPDDLVPTEEFNAGLARDFLDTDQPLQKVILLSPDALGLSEGQSAEEVQIVSAALAAGLGASIVGFAVGRLGRRSALKTQHPVGTVDVGAPERLRLPSPPVLPTASLRLDYELRTSKGGSTTLTYQGEFPDGRVLMRKGNFFEARDMSEIATHIDDTHQAAWLIVRKDNKSLFKLADGQELTKEGLTFRATGQQDASGTFALLEVRREGGLLEIADTDVRDLSVDFISKGDKVPTFSRPGHGELGEQFKKLKFKPSRGDEPVFRDTNRFRFGEIVVVERTLTVEGVSVKTRVEGLVIGRNPSGQIHVLVRGNLIETRNVAEVGSIPSGK